MPVRTTGTTAAVEATESARSRGGRTDPTAVPTPVSGFTVQIVAYSEGAPGKASIFELPLGDGFTASLGRPSRLAHSPSNLLNSGIFLGVESAMESGSRPKPKPTGWETVLVSLLACRVVLCEALAEANPGRIVDFPSSSSDEAGFSLAVVNDSAREPVVTLDELRPVIGGRC